MKQINQEILKDSGKLRLVKELAYNQIVPFVFENIRSKSLASRSYFGINILNLLLILYFLLPGNQTVPMKFHEFIIQFVSGLFAGSILVIPFHEGFHALAYKLAGAPKIYFGADLRQMIFYVSTDHFLIGRKAFYFVALAPFILINVAAISLFLFTGLISIFGLLFFLLFHNIMCIGDFAMIGFFQSFPDKELVTYDDHKKRISYILEIVDK